MVVKDKKHNIFEMLSQKSLPEIFSRDIQSGDDLYVILLKDFLNPHRKLVYLKQNRKKKYYYLVFECVLQEGFDIRMYTLPLHCKIHFPEEMFMTAFQNCRHPAIKDGEKVYMTQLDKNKMYDCKIYFMKPSERMIHILQKEIFEVPIPQKK